MTMEMRRRMAPLGSKEAEHRPSPQPEAVWPEGIFAEQEAPFPPSFFHAINRWQVNTGTSHLVVYAGYGNGDPARGLVIVSHVARDFGETWSEHPPPISVPALKIKKADGFLLLLESADGTQFRFDAQRRSYLPA